MSIFSEIEGLWDFKLSLMEPVAAPAMLPELEAAEGESRTGFWVSALRKLVLLEVGTLPLALPIEREPRPPLSSSTSLVASATAEKRSRKRPEVDVMPLLEMPPLMEAEVKRLFWSLAPLAAELLAAGLLPPRDSVPLLNPNAPLKSLSASEPVRLAALWGVDSRSLGWSKLAAPSGPKPPTPPTEPPPAMLCEALRLEMMLEMSLSRSVSTILGDSCGKSISSLCFLCISF